MPAPSPTPLPAPVSLPRDDAPHADLTEWWYYTGHLSSTDGRRYGFEFVVFQNVRGGNPVGYLSHFAITDVARRRFSYDYRADERSSIPPSLDLSVGGWALSGSGGNDRFSAAMSEYAIELALSSRKPAALHHGGFISFGPAGDSYYYSRTRMEVSGRLRDGDTWLEVKGQAWFDHQWGNFIVAPVGGWDWYSLQLDDGSEIMLSVVRSPNGAATLFGSYVDPTGRTVDLPRDAIAVEPLDTWTSPHTGARYPSGWQVRLAAKPDQRAPQATLRLEPILKDQELAFERLAYWEGAVSASGVLDGRPVRGEGYVELTGYSH